MSVEVKICGVRSVEAMQAAAAAGAGWLGFVFFPRSPRHLDWDAAAMLLARAPSGPRRVGLTVDPDDATLDHLAALPLDLLQLHGDETPGRVADIRARTGKPTMKAIGVADAGDLRRIADYEAVADLILLDAKPPRGAPLPGGTGLAFDWRLAAGRSWAKPWMLAGGLTAETVAEAVRLTGAPAVDVSSGVERAPGVKDAKLIADFCRAAGAMAVTPAA